MGYVWAIVIIHQSGIMLIGNVEKENVDSSKSGIHPDKLMYQFYIDESFLFWGRFIQS